MDPKGKDTGDEKIPPPAEVIRHREFYFHDRDPLKVIAAANPAGSCVDFWIRTGDRVAVGLAVERIAPGAQAPGPAFALSTAAAQALMDSLYRAGQLTPTPAAGSDRRRTTRTATSTTRDRSSCGSYRPGGCPGSRRNCSTRRGWIHPSRGRSRGRNRSTPSRRATRGGVDGAAGLVSRTY